MRFPMCDSSQRPVMGFRKNAPEACLRKVQSVLVGVDLQSMTLGQLRSRWGAQNYLTRFAQDWAGVPLFSHPDMKTLLMPIEISFLSWAPQLRTSATSALKILKVGSEAGPDGWRSLGEAANPPAIELCRPPGGKLIECGPVVQRCPAAAWPGAASFCLRFSRSRKGPSNARRS